MKKEIAQRRKLLFSFVFVMILLFSFSVVLAQGAPDATAAGEGLRGIGKWFIEFFNAFLGIDNGNNFAPFVNIFMALVLFSFIYSIIDSMGFFYKSGTTESSPLVWIVSLSVTALMLMAIVPSQLFTVILPSYGAAGATILTMVPFLIIFWFSIKVRSPTMARMIWIVFSFYFLVSYIWGAFDKSNGPPWTGAWGGWLYLIARILGVLMILLMGPIRSLIHKGSADEIATDVEAGGKILAAFKQSQFEQAKAEADGAKNLS